MGPREDASVSLANDADCTDRAKSIELLRILAMQTQDYPRTCARTGTVIAPISGLSSVMTFECDDAPGFTRPTPLGVPV